ncbi:MAG TPA: phosphoenolpyruvate synthase, partial [Chloroflexia bacterium]
MRSYVLGFQDIDRTQLNLVGGKGANLGELCKIAGIRVPDGFCLSTAAYQRIISEAPAIHPLLDRLAPLKANDRDRIAELSGEIRRLIAGVAVPQDIRAEIARHLTRLGEHSACAVRSSATAEDLPGASFAGQQDTYLNIIGEQAILEHIRQCWASLFTARAVTYRLQNGFDHRKVSLAVVVQQMVFAQAAGIMFTADPVTGNRKVLSIDAGFGLGEALVSGVVNADTYKVRNGTVLDKTVSTKKRAVYALPGGGTQVQEVAPEQQNRPVLSDEQIVQLERIGRVIEDHFGFPQDIEWCLTDDGFYIVQSRPITTLFPIPEANDQENHVYISVGHQQMMTDPIKPLGLSFFLLTTPAPMRPAGGRLFVDVTRLLASPAGRASLLAGMGRHDPLLKDALETLIERGDFIKPLPTDETGAGPARSPRTVSPASFDPQTEYDPRIVADLIAHSQASIAELKRQIATKSGSDLLDFILEDIQQLRTLLFDPRSSEVFMTAMNASAWLNENIQEWLGERNVAGTLSQSVPNNITSEMGLELLDLADVIRPYPEVVEYLRHASEDRFLDGLLQVRGGKETRAALDAYLGKYGMRGAGEIDITRTRWSENP